MIVGALGTRGRARVDERGSVAVVGASWTLGWWIGADDRWRDPAREPAVRGDAAGSAAVHETYARVPGGDAVQRVYGIGGPGGLVVVEVENASPAAFVVAFAVGGAHAVELDGSWLVVDGRPAVLLPFPPPRWSYGSGAVEPERIGRETGALPARTDRAGNLHVALLYPLSHRNRLRILVATTADPPGPVDLALVPAPDAAARGWARQLERGMRVVVPDERDQRAIDLARTQVLLDPDPDAATTAALEDWGFDAEAAWAWAGLSLRARRAARRRAGLADEATPAARLVRTRAALVGDAGPDLELLPAVPTSWQGGDLEVHDAPTRHGAISFALRWHGDRPALLWERRGPQPGVVIRASGLDPAWSSTDARGETLLRAVDLPAAPPPVGDPA